MITKFKGVLKNKESKVLFENLLSLSALQLINYILPFITIPYLARVIGVEKFGIIAFSSAVIIFFITFTDYGFNYTAVRDLAKNRDDKSEVSKILCTVMTIRFLLVLISFLIFLALIFTIPQLEEYQLILSLSFLSVPGYAIFPEWFFQGMERMKHISIINVVSKVICTLLIFVVVKNENDYFYVPVLTALGYFVSGLFSIFHILFNFKINVALPKISDIIVTIKGSTNMFLSLLLPNLYTNFSTILLETYGGKTAVGIFDSGNKFIVISQQFTNVLSRAFFPFLARRIDKHRLYEYVSLILSVVISICLFFGAELIISIFYTDEFKNSILVLKIMAVSPIFLFMMNAYGTNYLVLINKEKVLRNIIFYCSVFGGILSFWAVINYSYIGVASSIVTVWGLRGIITWYFARHYRLLQNNIS